MTRGMIQAPGQHGVPEGENGGTVRRILVWVSLLLILVAIPYAADARQRKIPRSPSPITR